jgi:hypothetical protein
MRDQEIVGLWESYLQVCGNHQLDEVSKELAGRVVNARIAKTGAAFDREMKDRTPENMRDTMDAADKESRSKKLAAGVRTRRNVTNEEVDIFDVILEHLVDEGYADTNKSALAIMANMSEEWREEILDEAITSEKGKAKAAEMIAARSTPSGRAKSGKGANVAQIRKIGRSNREGLGGTPMTPTMAKNPVKKKNYDGTGNKAARRAGTYSRFGYKDPSN